MIKIYDNDIVKVYIGDSEVTKGLVGQDVIYQKGDIDYSTRYFTINALSAGTISWAAQNVEYSVNNGEWTTFATSLNVSEGDKVRFRSSGNTAYATSSTNYKNITSTAEMDVEGNIMSLLYGDNFSGQTSLSADYVFESFFRGNNKLINAKNLVLPALNVTKQGYERLFANCSSLLTAPKILPATTIGQTAYCGMFENCSSLISAPEIVVPSSPQQGFYYMFQNCTSLVTAPKIDTSTFGRYTCEGMFKGCSSLKTIPEFASALTIGYESFKYMFQDCTSLETAPVLNIVSLGGNQAGGLREMFKGCTSLVDASDISIPAVYTSTCREMFFGCSSLTAAPSLPATTIHSACYQQMFMFCTALETAPELLATNVPSDAYLQMFLGCSKLNYIKCMATSITDGATSNWVNGVATAGTFVQSDSMDDWTIGYNGIPTNWVVQGGYNVRYFSIEAEAPATISWDVANVEYSTDGETWNAWTGSTALAANDVALFRSSGNTTYSGKTISSTGDIVAYGNIMSLFYGDNFFGQTSFPSNSGYEFRGLFKNCTNLLNVQYLKLNATTLDSYCYANMFEGCTGLTTVPKLPATTLAANCYYSMFMGCTSLNAVPILPATTLAESCYAAMFMNCTSLATAPALNAATMAQNCYSYMFDGCSSLATAPTLPSTSLAYGCYFSMFHNAGLTTAPALPATTLAEYCYADMFEGCSGLTVAPKLKAEVVPTYAYFRMFKDCSSLESINCRATDISATNATTEWVDGVASAGNFYRAESMTGWTTGVNGIPTNWTVFTKTPLPSNTYLCNYNAKDFDDVNQTFMRSESGQTFDYDLVKTWGSGTLAKNGDKVTIANNWASNYDFGSNENNIFNQNNNSLLTIVYKAQATSYNASQNIIANRTGGPNMNWMCRPQGLHDNSTVRVNFTPSQHPETMVIRVSGTSIERKCIETNQIATQNGSFSSKQSRYIAFFTGYADSPGQENFRGDFYWAYVSREYLTDAEVQQVIDYNEDK